MIEQVVVTAYGIPITNYDNNITITKQLLNCMQLLIEGILLYFIESLRCWISLNRNLTVKIQSASRGLSCRILRHWRRKTSQHEVVMPFTKRTLYIQEEYVTDQGSRNGISEPSGFYQFLY